MVILTRPMGVLVTFYKLLKIFNLYVRIYVVTHLIEASTFSKVCFKVCVKIMPPGIPNFLVRTRKVVVRSR